MDTARPPAAALAFGFAGLLPLAGAIFVEIVLRRGGDPGPSAFMVAMPALGYAALILSFLGGTWWSAACSRVAGAPLWGWLGAAVAPSLWAAASFLARPPHGTAVMLAVGLLGTLMVDRAGVRAGLLPPWWLRLRVPLSCGLAVETLAVAWLT